MSRRYQRILIVEDDEALSRVIARNLEARGFDVLLAQTAADALTKIVENQPDLMLLDILLPDRTGWDILRRLQNYDLALPVVVISGVRVSQERLHEFHPLAYLPKPFPLEALLRIVERGKDGDNGAVGDGPARLRTAKAE